MSSFGCLRFSFTHTYSNFSCYFHVIQFTSYNVTFHVCLRRQVAAVFETIMNRFHPLPHGATTPIGPGPPHYRGFTITPRHTTLGRTPLDDWLSPKLKTLLDNIQQAEETDRFEPAIPASERPQTHVLTALPAGLRNRLLIWIIHRNTLYFKIGHSGYREA